MEYTLPEALDIARELFEQEPSLVNEFGKVELHGLPIDPVEAFMFCCLKINLAIRTHEQYASFVVRSDPFFFFSLSFSQLLLLLSSSFLFLLSLDFFFFLHFSFSFSSFRPIEFLFLVVKHHEMLSLAKQTKNPRSRFR